MAPVDWVKHPPAGVTRTRVLHRRDGANCLPPLLLGEGWGEVGKSNDQRKPFGCAITRFSFPPKLNFATTPREQSHGQSSKGWQQLNPSLRALRFAGAWQSQTLW